MHPLDLQSERERRTRKAYQAVARDARQAALNADRRDVMLLEQVIVACQTRAIAPEEAHRQVSTLRDGQRHRMMRAA